MHDWLPERKGGGGEEHIVREGGWTVRGEGSEGKGGEDEAGGKEDEGRGGGVLIFKEGTLLYEGGRDTTFIGHIFHHTGLQPTACQYTL